MGAVLFQGAVLIQGAVLFFNPPLKGSTISGGSTNLAGSTISGNTVYHCMVCFSPQLKQCRSFLSIISSIIIKYLFWKYSTYKSPVFTDRLFSLKN